MPKVPKMKECTYSAIYLIASEIKYLKMVIPTKAGIQAGTGCPRIAVRGRLLKSGMTGEVYLVARLIIPVCRRHTHQL